MTQIESCFYFVDERVFEPLAPIYWRRQGFGAVQRHEKVFTFFRKQAEEAKGRYPFLFPKNQTSLGVAEICKANYL